MSRTISVLPLIYALLITFASCSDKNHINSGAVWGTTYRIVYNAPRDLTDSVITVLNAVDRDFSMFSPASLVSAVNANDEVSISPAFRRLFELSQHISTLSGGAFDPTVGPLTDLWGFGTVKSDSCRVPDREAIQAAVSTVGINRCHIDGNRIVKPSPLTRFDFSSVAKGYAVDRIAEMLLRNGASGLLVEIGGEIATRGLNPRGRKWRVQIDAPVIDNPDHIAMQIITLDDEAVATSGNYRNYRLSAGRQIGHTIDPRTGYPVVTSTLSATVIAPDCASADALATACMVMPADSALAMIERLPHTEVLLAVASTDSMTLHASSGFPKQL